MSTVLGLRLWVSGSMSRVLDLRVSGQVSLVFASQSRDEVCFKFEI